MTKPDIELNAIWLAEIAKNFYKICASNCPNDKEAELTINLPGYEVMTITREQTSIPFDIDPEFHKSVEALKQNKKILAIKEYRAITGADLKESKEKMEEWFDELDRRGEIKRTGV